MAKGDEKEDKLVESIKEGVEEGEEGEEDTNSKKPDYPTRESARKTSALLTYYSFSSEGIPVDVRISKKADFVPIYEVTIQGIAEGTKLILETKLRAELITEVKLDISEILDPKRFADVKKKFLDAAVRILQRNFPSLPADKMNSLAVYLLQNTLGLGELEILLSDELLEEIAINNSRDPIWIYHKKFGWCKTNLRVKNEEMIYDYASMI